jgi:putative membrane protein
MAQVDVRASACASGEIMPDAKGPGMGDILHRVQEVASTAVGMAGASTPGQTSARPFIGNAEISNSYVIQACEIAEGRSPTPAVRQIADRLRLDHSSAREALRREAAREERSPPFSLDQRHEGLLQILESEPPGAFDTAFLHQMLAGRLESLTFYKGHVHNGDDVRLRQLAETEVPVLETHLDAIRNSIAEVAAGSGAKAPGAV